MNKFHFLAAALLLAGSSSLYAADETLAPIVVTATRTAQTADETLASVTVITRADIEREQASSVQDALRGIAGVDIANNGGPGKTTSVFLRGTESDHVLVLVDGVRVGSATLGTAAFQDIPIDQVERIEIVRGPRSSLYGSEAIGGVIQIFTRKGGGPTTPHFSIGAGSYHTYKAFGGVSGGGTRGWYNLSMSSVDTEGFNACNGKPFPGGAGCFTYEPDKDGYRNASGAFHAGYRFANGVTLDTHALRATGHNQYDGSYTNESNFMQQVIGGRLRFSPADFWHLSFTAGRSWDQSDGFLNGTFMNTFDTRRDTLSLQNDIEPAAGHLLTVGYDYQDDRVNSTLPYPVTSRDDNGVFAQYQAGFGAHDILLGLRNDDDQQFGHRTTGNLAWGYTFGGMRLSASYGTAFKAPTFNELYYPGYGNPNLAPEKSHSAELGLNGKTGGGNWSLHAYQTQVDDLIAYDASIFAPGNVDAARIRGLEAVLSTRLAGWAVATNLTLLDPKNRSAGPDRGKLLPRRAKQTLRVDLNRAFGKIRLGATVFAAGRRFDDLANTRRLGGYTTVELRAGYALRKHWRLQARLGNLLDKRYETAAFFNQPGRNVFLTLRYRPGAD